MDSSNELFTKESELIYKSFIKNTLLRIGFNPTLSGINYLTETIWISYQTYLLKKDISLKDIYTTLGLKNNLSASTIRCHIFRSIYLINKKRFDEYANSKENYKNKYLFESIQITTKGIILIFINLLEQFSNDNLNNQ